MWRIRNRKITILMIVVTLYLLFELRDIRGPSVYQNDTLAKLKAYGMKFILIWTNPSIDPIKYLGNGIDTFVKHNCQYINCYVSPNRGFFEDVKDFDVLVFHGTELSGAWITDLPKSRAPHQKYVFASMESSDFFPICDNKYNGFFNWTWTYKFNSDEVYGYITVTNEQGYHVAPKNETHWMRLEEMKPIDDEFKAKLRTKKIAAAWFVSNCNARNQRLQIANELKSELAKYDLILDIYGRCGTKSCPSKNMKDCLKMVERDYYFYLSFENSYAEDYVTEKLLHAVQHYAVPIVLGGANYTRFMPDGIYLNARTDTVEQLAQKMADAIQNEETYHNYFRWHNHYSYHHVEEFPETNAYCRLCAMINNKELMSATSIQKDFVSWWNPPGRCE